MKPGSAAPRNGSIGPWVWMLPIAYSAHVVEEAFGGHGLAAWIVDLGGVRFSIAGFLGINLVALAVIAAVTWASRRSTAWRWGLVSGGAILFVNGISHVAASAAMRYYVPGMWTGIAFYIPLGAALLLRVRRVMSPRLFWAAAAAGFAIHALVLWIVFGMPGL
jgi:hypothetical protein